MDVILRPEDVQILITNDNDRPWRILLNVLRMGGQIIAEGATDSPFEKPLHEIFKSEVCLSPIPSLAIHATNINSIYGISPVVNIKKLWDDNKI